METIDSTVEELLEEAKSYWTPGHINYYHRDRFERHAGVILKLRAILGDDLEEVLERGA